MEPIATDRNFSQSALRTNWEHEAARSGKLSGNEIAFFRQMDIVAKLINEHAIPVSSLGVKNASALTIVVQTDDGAVLTLPQQELIRSACGGHPVTFQPTAIIDAD